MAEPVLLNILKDTKDPHYRYKMPKLTAKVEGSGNGIKTVLTNISAVARSLGRPASYPTKYFGCELGAQVTMHNNIYVVNGAHDPDALLNLLYAFIRKFVLCPKCANPETELSVNVASSVIRQKCAACGAVGSIDRSAHRLTTFILSHPPGSSGAETGVSGAAAGVAGTNGTNGKAAKAEKGTKKAASKKHGKGTNGTASQDPAAKASTAATQPADEEDADADAFDDEELSEQAYLERLHEGLATGMFINDPKKSADVFYKLVKAKKEAGVLLDAQVQRELAKEAGLLEIKDKAPLILGELLFTESGILDEIVTYRMLFLRFCSDNPKAQKYVLGAYEKLVGDVYKDALFPLATKILKQLYDQDIVDEETILEWSTKESKKYVSKDMAKKIREKVAPFIKWLREAEESESDEEDEGKAGKEPKAAKASSNGAGNGANGAGASDESPEPDDEEESPEDDEFLEFSHRVSGIQLQSEPVAPAAAAAAGGGAHDEENDIDIDNI